jgi:hypothetical protein
VIDDGLQLSIDFQPGVAAGAENFEIHEDKSTSANGGVKCL